MAYEQDLAELLGLEPDERLLDEHAGRLPSSVGRPEALPQSRARRRLVGFGATMTGVSLVAGIALIAVGIVVALSSSVALGVVAVVLGVVLVSTHWGWVHVAEVTANSIEARHTAVALARRRQWLSGIEPYTRYEVTTQAAGDGSITIETTRHQPTPEGAGSFTFVRETVGSERHSGEEPAAAVAERAELLRRRAAADTARERDRYETANDAYQSALLANADEKQRLAAVRAASEALSEQINVNLRDPPLTE